MLELELATDDVRFTIGVLVHLGLGVDNRQNTLCTSETELYQREHEQRDKRGELKEGNQRHVCNDLSGGYSTGTLEPHRMPKPQPSQ